MLVEELVQKVAVISEISRTSVYRIVREYRSNHSLSEPKAYPSRKKITEAIDDFDRCAIRRKVHSFFFRNKLPTVDKILKDVNEDTDLPNCKRTTFYQLLKELDFRFLKRGRNSLLLEKEKIIVWKRNYLRKIRQFRDQGRKVYYLDETWVNAGHTQGKVWMDRSIKSSRQAFLGGLSTGLKNPAGNMHFDSRVLFLSFQLF
nr:unnamed protein product [Callosobruchus chinensis]